MAMIRRRSLEERNTKAFIIWECKWKMCPIKRSCLNQPKHQASSGILARRRLLTVRVITHMCHSGLRCYLQFWLLLQAQRNFLAPG
jgi:hypothetical protein